MLKQILMSSVLLIAPVMSAVDLVKNNKPVAKIYLKKLDPRNSLPTVREMSKMSIAEQKSRLLSVAVKDLNYHLKKMSGTELEIVITSDPSQVKAPAIVIGALAKRFGVAPKEKSELGEAFRLKTRNGMVLIAGESDIACAYGIYELLERLGCDWVMPGVDGEVVPAKNEVSIADIDLEQSPSFSVRCPWYSGGRAAMPQRCRTEFDLWKLRHKEQIARNWHPEMMVGGHIWDKLIRKYKQEFDKHPEMLALVRQPDGTMKRQGPQLETTDPKVLELFVKYIREMFRKNKWPHDKTICIGVGPADGAGFSESPESTMAGSGRIDPMSGTPDITDLQILLCNQLIKRLEPEFPNLRLGFYLYNTPRRLSDALYPGQKSEYRARRHYLFALPQPERPQQQNPLLL